MEKPVIKDKAILAYVEFLEKELEIYKRSPLVDAYLSTLNFLNKIDGQIKSQSIDIFSAKNKPLFEMAHKFLVEKRFYLEQLEYIRGLMNSDEKKEVEKQNQMKSAGIAEKIAMNELNR